MKLRLTAFAIGGLIGLSSTSSPLTAQVFRYLAFGDSITRGFYDTYYDADNEEAGYPRRLRDHLNCGSGACEIVNAGEGGEKTYQGVTRIDGVLDNQGPFDVLLLMEGTNDIFKDFSVESIKTNLKIMANKAIARGTETVHGSIIWFHPDGYHGTSKNDEVRAVRDGLINISNNNQRWYVDIWDELCPNSHPDRHGHGQNACFNQHYSDTCPGRPPPCGDNRGHPIGSGYDMMALRWYESLTASNTPAKPTLISPEGPLIAPEVLLIWNKSNRANWYRLVVENSSGPDVDVLLEARTVCSQNACYYRLTGLRTGTFDWRVRGRNPRGWGSWSSEKRFTFPTLSLFDDGFESQDTSAWPDVSP
jgi:lysophospholipase L1-like esterase